MMHLDPKRPCHKWRRIYPPSRHQFSCFTTTRVQNTIDIAGVNYREDEGSDRPNLSR